MWSEAIVRAKLVEASFFLNLGDYRPARNPHVGMLDDHTYQEIPIPLNRDVSYAVLAVCDDDCKLLGVGLYDDEGYPVDYCDTTTRACSVSVKPRRNQDYVLRVYMGVCAKAPCYYGLGLYN